MGQSGVKWSEAGKMGQSEVKWDRPGQSGTERGKAGQIGAKRDNARRSETECGKVELGEAGRGGTTQGKAGRGYQVSGRSRCADGPPTRSCQRKVVIYVTMGTGPSSRPPRHPSGAATLLLRKRRIWSAQLTKF